MELKTFEIDAIKEFIEDYQKMSMGDLSSKYEDDKYARIITDDKVFKYMKDNDLLHILIEKDPSAKYYTALIQDGSGYKVNTATYAKSFNTLDEAAYFKLDYLISYFYSSLTRK